MESLIKETLKTTKFESTGKGGQGCINVGSAYKTDNGLVFVKRNSRVGARVMFDGEYAGLAAILATKTVRVPEPYVVLNNPKGGAVLVMEYLDMSHLSKHSEKLGEQLAKLHLHNASLEKQEIKQASSIHKATNEDGEELHYTDKFGFNITTCCGYLPMDNTWCDNWIEFYARNRLQMQIRKMEEEHGDREVMELWSQLQLKIPQFFTDDLVIKPALLHGDLWSGNAAELPDEPVIFDTASFYGHSEFDLAIASMFGGFSRGFFEAYHKVIPKSPGFEKRLKLYELFHYLNHWNHFGSGYRQSSVATMRKLLK